MHQNYIFLYEGPVLSFGKVIQNRWVYWTKAETISKALNNLAWNYKRINQLSNNFKIELDKNHLIVKGKEKNNNGKIHW